MSNDVILKLLRGAVAIALLTLIAPAAAAQNRPTRITCQARATLNPGITLTYQLTGLLPETTAQPPNPATGLTLTVQWQDRSGRVQTLIRDSALSDYAQLAPDADYSKLPFDPAFRGQRNNADRIYGAPASVHGLSVSLRPTRGQPQQMQTVHYLRPGNLVRSGVGTCRTENPELERLINEQLSLLQTRLDAKDWAGADLVTRRLLAPQSTPTPPFDAVQLSPDQIRAIDRMWVTASNGRFGLSVQVRLWRAARAAHPRQPEAAVNALRDRLGWTLKTPRTEQDFISSDWLNESELTYSLTAPEGHLPWAGVSDAVVQAVAVPPPGVHCGVCTVDAMQLRNERFYQYIPQRMGQVEPVLFP